MKVLGIVGSPRKNGNTQLLVNSILEGAKQAGAETEMVHLADIEINECDGCHSCWKGRSCVKDDDMNGIYAKVAASDVIVFGTPVYWFGPTGLMKMFLDRFVYFNCPENQTMVEGKKAILAVPFEDTDLETARPLVDMFRKSTDYLKMDMADILLVPGVTRRGEVKERKKELGEGFEMGVRSVVASEPI